MIRLTDRRLMAMTIAAGALTLAGAASAVGMAAASGGHAAAAPHAARATRAVAAASPAAPILCVAYAHSWGICIGPPTN